eukprot:352800-Chlamydomonas_euryale.AAC.12
MHQCRKWLQVRLPWRQKKTLQQACWKSVGVLLRANLAAMADHWTDGCSWHWGQVRMSSLQTLPDSGSGECSSGRQAPRPSKEPSSRSTQPQAYMQRNTR